MKIPFNKPYMTGKELDYIVQAHASGHLSGDGPFTKKCSAWLQEQVGCRKALLTHSGTVALEMAAILADINPGDEVIMPSYTFVSTANAFALRGGVPVFVDIRPDTLNMDESLVEEAVTKKTKAIVPVHYAGVGCEMEAIVEVAKRHNLLIIEDAAHGIMATYKGQPLGSIGHMAALSFHETKNITSGEGGALLINDSSFEDRAEVIREKGTDRSMFFKGQVDKYTWIDIGSSYLPSELCAAFLWAQMQEAHTITERRLDIWGKYHEAFGELESQGRVRRPIVPTWCRHNAHMYYLLLPSPGQRTRFIAELERNGIGAVFHYVPLDSSPAGDQLGRRHGSLAVTQELSGRVVRLPLWVGLEDTLDHVIEQVLSALERVAD